MEELREIKAEIDPDEKNRISHRGQALRILLAALEKKYSG